jgi:hypothetical protein
VGRRDARAEASPSPAPVVPIGERRAVPAPRPEVGLDVAAPQADNDGAWVSLRRVLRAAAA